MKSIVATLVFGLVCVAGFSQIEKGTATVRLKDGSTFKGSVQNIDPDGAVLFKTQNGSNLRIPSTKVRRITFSTAQRNPQNDEKGYYDIYLIDGSAYKSVRIQISDQAFIVLITAGDTIMVSNEDVEKLERIDLANKEYQTFTSGFYHRLEIGWLLGKDNFDQTTTSFSIQTVNGYRLFNRFDAGLGIGVDFYDQFTTMPLFLNALVDLTRTRVIPYYFGSAGYSMAWQNSKSQGQFNRVKGGLTWGAGMGIKIPVDGIAILVKAGYREQRVSTRTGNIEEFGFETEQKRKMRRFELSTGITF